MPIARSLQRRGFHSHEPSKSGRRVSFRLELSSVRSPPLTPQSAHTHSRDSARESDPYTLGEIRSLSIPGKTFPIETKALGIPHNSANKLSVRHPFRPGSGLQNLRRRGRRSSLWLDSRILISSEMPSRIRDRRHMQAVTYDTRGPEGDRYGTKPDTLAAHPSNEKSGSARMPLFLVPCV